MLEIVTDFHGSDLRTSFAANDDAGYEFDLFRVLSFYDNLRYTGDDTDSKAWRTRVEYALSQLGFYHIVSHERVVDETVELGRITYSLEGRIVCFVYPIVKYQSVVACDRDNGHNIVFRVPLTYGVYERKNHPHVCGAFLTNAVIEVDRYSSYGDGTPVQRLVFSLGDKHRPILSGKLVGTDPANPENTMTMACIFLEGKLNHISWTEDGAAIDRPLRTYGSQ